MTNPDLLRCRIYTVSTILFIDWDVRIKSMCLFFGKSQFLTQIKRNCQYVGGKIIWLSEDPAPAVLQKALRSLKGVSTGADVSGSGAVLVETPAGPAAKKKKNGSRQIFPCRSPHRVVRRREEVERKSEEKY